MSSIIHKKRKREDDTEEKGLNDTISKQPPTKKRRTNINIIEDSNESDKENKPIETEDKNTSAKVSNKTNTNNISVELKHENIDKSTKVSFDNAINNNSTNTKTKNELNLKKNRIRKSRTMRIRKQTPARINTNLKRIKRRKSLPTAETPAQIVASIINKYWKSGKNEITMEILYKLVSEKKIQEKQCLQIVQDLDNKCRIYLQIDQTAIHRL
eukprot:434974_1